MSRLDCPAARSQLGIIAVITAIGIGLIPHSLMGSTAVAVTYEHDPRWTYLQLKAEDRLQKAWPDPMAAPPPPEEVATLIRGFRAASDYAEQLHLPNEVRAASAWGIAVSAWLKYLNEGGENLAIPWALWGLKLSTTNTPTGQKYRAQLLTILGLAQVESGQWEAGRKSLENAELAILGLSEHATVRGANYVATLRQAAFANRVLHHFAKAEDLLLKALQDTGITSRQKALILADLAFLRSYVGETKAAFQLASPWRTAADLATTGPNGRVDRKGGGLTESELVAGELIFARIASELSRIAPEHSHQELAIAGWKRLEPLIEHPHVSIRLRGRAKLLGARIAIVQTQHGVAHSLCQQVSQETPASDEFVLGELRLVQGLLLAAKGNHQDAIPLFTRSAALLHHAYGQQPPVAEAVLALAESYIAIGDPQREVDRLCRQAIECSKVEYGTKGAINHRFWTAKALRLMARNERN